MTCSAFTSGNRTAGQHFHLNARDATLVFASPAPQFDIERLKVRIGWRKVRVGGLGESAPPRNPVPQLDR
jgi:predicted dithiol-disulfide oxidoreductase (DUF899 family)